MKKVGFIFLVLVIIVAMGCCTCGGTYLVMVSFLKFEQITKLDGVFATTATSIIVWLILWCISSALLIRSAYRHFFKK